MPRISLAFFGAAVLYGLTGMGLGMAMGATETFTLAPVHAHINLMGWTTLAIMGGFYALAGDRANPRLAWANFALSNLGNLISLPLLAIMLLGNRAFLPVMAAGEALVVLGMLLFGLSVLGVARKPA